jgi:hypothetical protein
LQGLKLGIDLIGFIGPAKQLAEKVRFSIRNPRSIPQGLKPRIYSIGVMPGMNPRPTARMSFSASCKAVPLLQSESELAAFAARVSNLNKH